MKFLLRFLLSLALVLSVFACQPNTSPQNTAVATKLPPPELKRMSYEQYGIDVQSKQVLQDTLEEDQFLKDVLSPHQVTPATIDKIERIAAPIFDVRRMRAGNPFTLIKNQQQVDYFIYERTPADFVVIDLRDSVEVYEGQRKVVLRQQGLGGFINSTLFETIQSKGLEVQISKRLEEIFAWSVDFSYLDAQDYFKVIYEEAFVDEVSIGISQIRAVQFHHRGQDYYAFGYNQDSLVRYFDENGRSVVRTFLRTPLKYTGTSSSEASEPVAEGKNTFAYVASKGTPVLAVGNGTIATMKQSRRWGKQIRIDHGQLYATEYLRLGDFRDSLSEGQRVNQGDVIGFVGRNENAGLGSFTFRLRKQGRTVNPSDLTMPDAPSVSEEHEKAFLKMKEKWMRQLDEIPLKENHQGFSATS
ncbi:MAG: peptidoglycan DD-metalloendopeptidase family protein [Bacteroidota bacterium]